MQEPDRGSVATRSSPVSAPLTFGSLFAGIGGFDLGFERAGMVCKWQVEIDDYANRVLAKHWPNVRRWPDVRTWPQPDTEWVDVICGGFPCQPVSLAGRRKGKADPRWLWPEFRRVLDRLRPRVGVVENVPGLLTNGFTDVLCDIAALGYDAEWSVLSACAMGAPHTRERLFVVVHAEGDGWRAWTEESEESWRRITRPKYGLWAAAAAEAVRGTNRVSSRVDRLRCVGNAVCPSVSEWIGRRIVEACGAGAIPVSVSVTGRTILIIANKPSDNTIISGIITGA